MRLFAKSTFLVLNLILICGFFYNIHPQSTDYPQVKIITDSDLKKILEKEQGSAVLINVWATWCEPCREEFPELVELANNFKNKIRFIGISVDDVADMSTKVIPFLKSQNVTFENYLIKIREPEDFINMLNEDWSGAVPATFIYDKNGKQRIVLVGKQSYDEFETAIKKVID